jgi:putative transposase
MRQPRVVIPGLPHYVTLRANNRRRLFSYKREYELFIFLLEQALLKFPCLLHGAVLMTNHVHLLVTPETEKALSQLVKYTSQRFAQIRNRRRGGTGRLFDARYHSDPIFSEQHLAAATAYTELNPVRAGMVRDANQYRWSTYGLHVDEACAFPRAMWTPSEWYLSIDASRAGRAREYRTWLTEYHRSGKRPESLPPAKVRELARQRLRRPDGSSAA